MGNGILMRSHEPVPVPKTLKGFPDAVKKKGKTPFPGGIRKRWETKDGKILEWDSRHGEIEMFHGKTGEHLGSFDHGTGKKIKEKIKTRNIKEYL